ncbi:MAG: sugar ABC transporter permease [Oscillospiraceae bacterium]|jgi:multiple sugar transport system permease protein|nr:sugar ABC transporter permease [Oscillospiraceae bacterium]
MTQSVPPLKKKMSKLERRNTLIAYSFLAPNFLGFLLFTLIPVLFSILLAFLNWNGGTFDKISWAGFSNFATIFKNFSFTRSDLGITLRNTVVYTLFTVPITVAGALLLALVLNKAVRGMKFFRVVFFFPYVASVVAICVCWNFLLMKYGPINQLFSFFGINIGKSWTQSRDHAMAALVLVSVWRSVGYYMVMYLAGLQGVPRELYEAAIVDGANPWQKFWKITFPMLTPTTFFCTLMMTIGCFKVYDIVEIMTQGGPGRATKMLVTYIFELSFEQIQYGVASSVAMVLFVVVLLITIFQFRMEKRWVNYM